MKLHLVSPAAFEKWDYRNPDTIGIGGSETAHIEMALRLAARGHDVTSYSPLPADCPNVEHGGVYWRDISDVDWNAAGLWLLYRCPAALDSLDPDRTDQPAWVICQDIDYQAEWSVGVAGELRQKQVRRVVALCQAQAKLFRERYPLLRDKIHVSSNGIKGELVDRVLAEGITRDPRHVVYASSPDRALDPLKYIFPEIRRYVPDARLTVAYGFDNLDKNLTEIEARKPEHVAVGEKRWAQRTRATKEWLATTPGVTHRGRMPQPELYRLVASSGLWIYAVRFLETSCISVMECQSLGAVPIFTPVWAVGENARHGISIEDSVEAGVHNWLSQVDDPLTLDRFVQAAVDLMLHPAKQEEIRRVMMPWARRQFCWNRFVDQFEAWSREDLGDA